jgi:hypothetical protein
VIFEFSKGNFKNIILRFVECHARKALPAVTVLYTSLALNLNNRDPMFYMEILVSIFKPDSVT